MYSFPSLDPSEIMQKLHPFHFLSLN
jgi:hypothetical protein